VSHDTYPTSVIALKDNSKVNWVKGQSHQASSLKDKGCNQNFLDIYIYSTIKTDDTEVFTHIF